MEWNRGRVRCLILHSNLHRSECLGGWLLGAKIVQVSSMSLRVAGGVEIKTRQPCFPKTKLVLGTFESHHPLTHSSGIAQILIHAHNTDTPASACTWTSVFWWDMSNVVNLFFTIFVPIFPTSCCLLRPFLFFVN